MGQLWHIGLLKIKDLVELYIDVPKESDIMSLIRISESDNWITDYNTERGMYKVSYFEDGHFVDQYRFDCYEEKEVTNKIKLIGYLETVKENEKRKLGNHLYLGSSQFEYFMNNLIINIKELLE